MTQDRSAPDASRTVLIVEDNLDNLLIYTTILEYSGISVISAKDGETGVAMAKRDLPDLILMDVSIPGIDGLVATRLLKADGSTRRIPLIILTAHALASDRIRAMDAGADGYIAKPADPKSVLAVVQQHLAGHPPAPRHKTQKEDRPQP